MQQSHLMPEFQTVKGVGDWWRVERPQIAAEFPQHADVVIERTQAAMQRAQSEGDSAVLADAAALSARAYAIKGQPENAVCMLDELLRAPGDQCSSTDRAAMMSSLGVAYDAMGKYPEALDCPQ